MNKGTGELRILKSVQAADAGVVANPVQCRGQVEGGVAQALGAALYESGRFTEAVAEFTQPCGSIQIWRGYAIIWNLRGERPALRSNSNRFHFRIGFIVRGSYAQ